MAKPKTKSLIEEAAEQAASRVAKSVNVDLVDSVRRTVARALMARALAPKEEPEPATPMPPEDPNDPWWIPKDETSS
jgi:hypothetical protein